MTAPAMAPPIRRMWRQALEDAKQTNKDRRQRVLAHADLAKRLTQEPLNYERPDQWTGYIPPRTLPDPRPYRSAEPELQTLNMSPRRLALVAIAAEAMRREGGHA